MKVKFDIACSLRFLLLDLSQVGQRRRHVWEHAGEGDRAGDEGDGGGPEEELRGGAEAVSVECYTWYGV